MRSLIASFVVGLTIIASASQTTPSWCIWDGEEYLKAPVLDQGRFWMDVVHNLHVNGEELSQENSFEGVGSCRFIPRSLGPNASDAIKSYIDHGHEIIPTRAYLSVDGNGTKFVVPNAQYAAGTNFLFFTKDFYSMDRPVCLAQQKTMIEIGQNTGGLRVNDIVIRKNQFGGVSVVLFENNQFESSYYGVCHFHSIQ